MWPVRLTHIIVYAITCCVARPHFQNYCFLYEMNNNVVMSSEITRPAEKSQIFIYIIWQYFYVNTLIAYGETYGSVSEHRKQVDSQGSALVAEEDALQATPRDYSQVVVDGYTAKREVDTGRRGEIFYYNKRNHQNETSFLQDDEGEDILRDIDILKGEFLLQNMKDLKFYPGST